MYFIIYSTMAHESIKAFVANKTCNNKIYLDLEFWGYWNYYKTNYQDNLREWTGFLKIGYIFFKYNSIIKLDKKFKYKIFRFLVFLSNYCKKYFQATFYSKHNDSNFEYRFY